MERRDLNPVLAIVAVVSLLIAGYLAGYFLLGTVIDNPFVAGPRYRVFPQTWIASMYRPVATMESWATSRDVYITIFEPLGPSLQEVVERMR